MKVSDIVFAAHLVPAILTGKLKLYVPKWIEVKVTTKRSYFEPINLTPF